MPFFYILPALRWGLFLKTGNSENITRKCCVFALSESEALEGETGKLHFPNFPGISEALEPLPWLPNFSPLAPRFTLPAPYVQVPRHQLRTCSTLLTVWLKLCTASSPPLALAPLLLACSSLTTATRPRGSSLFTRPAQGAVCAEPPSRI